MKKKIFIKNIDSIINETGVNVAIIPRVSIEHKSGDIFDLYIEHGCPNCDKVDAESPELYVCECSVENVLYIRFCDITEQILPENVNKLSLKQEAIRLSSHFVDECVVTLIYYNL